MVYLNSIDMFMDLGVLSDAIRSQEHSPGQLKADWLVPSSFSRDGYLTELNRAIRREIAKAGNGQKDPLQTLNQ